MSGWSRRRALHAVAVAGALAVAGCSDTTSSSSIPDETRERVTDFEAILRRDADGRAMVVTDDAATRNGDEPRVQSLMEYLTAESDVDDLRFRDGADAAALRSFVTATDLDTQSIYLLQRSIGACYVPRLVGVFREGDGVDAEFRRDLRPADVECDADAHDAFAVAIRLPFAGDEFNSVGGGWSSDCDHRPTAALTEGGDAS